MEHREHRALVPSLVLIEECMLLQPYQTSLNLVYVCVWGLAQPFRVCQSANVFEHSVPTSGAVLGGHETFGRGT